MATLSELNEEKQAADRPFAHLRATAEERARILSALVPFDVEAWRREVTPATRDELAALEEFLLERDEDRQRSLKLEQERLEAGR